MKDRDALEEVFAGISRSLDEVGPENHVAFLAKLALLLCREVGDLERIRELVASARLDLPGASGGEG